ncbi:MAG: trigger factor [Acholeplasmataceae bacterium]|nr:trigger factor [Acholeplasmataceae bacterium]
MKVEKLTTNQVKYTFDVSPEEFEHGLSHAFDTVQKDVELKGFRKGKVPRNIYETKFGVESLYEDAINHVLHHKYHEAQAHPDYEIVGQPDVDVDFASIKRGESFEVSLTAPVKPEVKLGQYKEVEVKDIDVTVSDADVDLEIKNLLGQKAELELKEGALELGDTAIFDFDGYLDNEPFEGGKAENYQLEIGSNQFIPGFEDQMVGMKSGDKKDLKVTFPENYQAENLKGKEVTFKVALHEVKTKNLPELTDEFVVSLEKEGVKTVEELKASTRTQLETAKKTQAEQSITSEIIEKVVNAAELDVPEVMVEDEIKQYKENIANQAKQYGLEYDMFLQMNGITPEQFDVQVKVESEKRVKTTLVIEEIAKLEGIKATEEELTAKYAELATQYKMEVDEIKKYIPASILEKDVIVNKAYLFVVDNAKKI